MREPRSTAIIVGKTTDMDEVVRAVMSGADEIRVTQTLEEAIAIEGFRPSLTVVCQHWSDEFSGESVQRLISTWPLSRVVCAYGPWCVSDGRRRSVWPHAVRVPVESAPGRIQREWDVIRGIRTGLPLTAGRDEIFAFDHGQ